MARSVVTAPPGSTFHGFCMRPTTASVGGHEEIQVDGHFGSALPAVTLSHRRRVRRGRRMHTRPVLSPQRAGTRPRSSGGKPTRSAGRPGVRAPEAARQPSIWRSRSVMTCPRDSTCHVRRPRARRPLTWISPCPPSDRQHDPHLPLRREHRWTTHHQPLAPGLNITLHHKS
jgi:hypothetical protein